MMRLPLATALVALLSCGSATEPGAPTLRVLFLGNSLTYTNDLPAMVKTIAAADGVELEVKSYAYPNWGLEDHWAAGTAAAEIAAGKWDLVIMQQGPSSLAESRINLLTWAIKFDELADLHETCIAMYMVWPAAANSASFGNVYANYKEAADTTGGQFFPAGRAWEIAWQSNGALPLYGPDDFHPSALGSYTAALVIAGGITGKDPTENDARISGVTAGGSAWSTARAAARDALVGVPRRCIE
jgi:hypothetical protein